MIWNYDRGTFIGSGPSKKARGRIQQTKAHRRRKTRR